MKVLLLTDIPPCDNNTAGLVLKRLCGFLPHGSAACFVVDTPVLGLKMAPEFSWMPYDAMERPREYAPYIGNPVLHPVAHFLRDSRNAAFEIRPLVDRIVAFGRDNQVDRVWCVLEGPSMFRIAIPVAESLGVPLLTQVYDPPDFWIIAYALDRISARRVRGVYERALRASMRCATASWEMAEQYHDQYGIETVPLVPSIDLSLSYPPAAAPISSDELVIGMAGQIYAQNEWQTLLNALESVNWVIGGRKVKVRLMGPELISRAKSSQAIEFLGWRPQQEVLHILSQCDINYCPYRFAPEFEVEAKLCFPSKLTSYLAAGRPVLFHGPDYASPAKFLERHDAGIRCYSLNPQDLVARLTSLFENFDEYGRLARNGSTAYRENLTLDVYRQHFADFLGVDESELTPLTVSSA